MKLIFVDIDNTLLDFDLYTERTLRKGFEKFGLGEVNQKTLKVFHEVNDQLWKEIESGLLTFEELQKIRFKKVFASLNIFFDGIVFETFYREELFNSAIPVESSYEMLDYLSKKYILAIASNGPYVQQIHRLELADMKKYFSYFFVSEKIGYSKPSIHFFEKAIDEINETYRFSRDEMCIIGDSLTSDIAGGMSVGIKTCFYNRGKHELGDKKPDFIVNKLSEIPLYL